MAMTINTNVVSLNAQRNSSLSAGSLATSMQRLSSGLRVNSAKDDAAGLAISERMQAQSKGLAVAARNANDGISLAQTAEGALGKVGDMLQRMRELAVQSSNATNSANDRKAMQAEVSQLISEIDRVAKTSSFNGAKLLNGDFAGAVFQVGSAAGDNITVGGIADITTSKLATINIGADKSADVAGLQAGFAAKIKSDTATDRDITITGAGGTEVTVSIAQDKNITDAAAVGKVVEAINSKSAETGVTAFLEVDPADASKSYIQVRAANSDGSAVNAAAGVKAGGVVAAAIVAAPAVKTGIDKLSVGTQSGSWEAIKQIDKALDDVNKSRGDLGALQTRFEKTVENIDIMNENISAARGRIVDADFASETANLSRSQILQQAGTAMIAQANQLPQNVLSLLR